jgi:hypothetical protein
VFSSEKFPLAFFHAALGNVTRARLAARRFLAVESRLQRTKENRWSNAESKTNRQQQLPTQPEKGLTTLYARRLCLRAIAPIVPTCSDFVVCSFPAGAFVLPPQASTDPHWFFAHSSPPHLPFSLLGSSAPALFVTLPSPSFSNPINGGADSQPDPRPCPHPLPYPAQQRCSARHDHVSETIHDNRI